MSDSKGMDDVGSDAVASDSAGGGSRSDSDGGGTPRRSRTRTRSGAGGDKRAVGDLGAAVGDEEDFDERFNPPPTEPDDSLVELCTAQGISDTTLHRKPHTVEYVDLFQCHAVEMRSLQYFRNLREVILIQLPRVDCIEGLEWCPLIERLWISECNLRVIEGLDKCSKLRLLNLDSNRITRIQNLGNCTALETLWINDNRLKSLEGVSEIKGLRTLWAARNSLTAIGTALDRNTCLTSLNVADNGIGYFKEIHNLARVPSLRHLCFSEPHFGDNPVCNLCNYQTYVLYQLPHVDTLDTVTLADDSKQLAEATYIKKKMYYNMRIKTLKRNTTNVIRRATEALQGRIGQINLSFNVLLRQKRDVERLMDEWKWTKEHGRAAVGCLEDAEAGDPDEEWLEQLRIKHEALQEATSHKTREVTRIDTQFARLKERLLGISEQNVTRMIVELGTGGNIRLEDGKASDVWFTSCVDLLHSRFFHRDFLPLGVSGVKVHRVTRVHNRFLRNRFDQRMSHLMTAIPSLSVGSSGSGSGGDSGRPARRSLEYLFFAPQVPALSSPTYASAELQRIAQEGFTERHLTGRAPVPPLRRTAGFRADQHVSYAQHHRRFAKRVEEERLAAIERDEEEDSASEESRDSDAPDEAPGVLLSNSLSFADMPRLCDSVAGAMEHGGGWSRGAAAAAGGASAPRGHGPIIGPEERPDVWLNRAGIDLERASTKFQLEHMRKSTEAASQGASRAAAAGTGSGGEAGASGNASMRLDAPEVSEGVIMIAKVFLGQCQSLDTSGRPASREADAKAKPADPTADGWHSACRPRSDDPKQRQWVVLDTALALPEYIIEFEYEWEPVLALPGGPGSGPQVPAATVTSELAALAEMSAGMGAASESDKPAPVRLTPQAEADLRPLVRPLAKFVSECREAARRGGASGGGSGGPPSGADGDFTMHALDLPPVLRSRTKISAITDSVLLGGLPASTPLDRLLIVNLHGNSIRVIEGLDALASLRVLVLSFNEIQRIGGLASLVKLERLDLGFNLIKRVEGLDGLESLRQLDLNNNLLYQLEDIQVLRRCCPDLQRLNLRNNGVCELKSYRSLVLRRMPSLEVLDGRPVSDADREEAAACATHITPQLILRYGRSGTGGHVSADLAGGGGARRSSPDEGGKEAKGGAGTGDDDDVVDAIRGGMGNEWFDEVETLDLSHMRLRRISSMDRLSRLVRLNLADNEISVIEGLDSLGVLEELSLEENRISKLEGLDNLRFLKKLDLGKNRISKVDGIAALTQLSQLSLEDNELSSLEGLAALPALMELYIGNNHIDSIKQILALKDLPKLIILDLSGNPLCSHATYRLYTVYHLRRLKVLDGVGVDSAEQASAKDKYSGRLTAEFLEEKIGHSYFEAIRELDLASCRIREIETLRCARRSRRRRRRCCCLRRPVMRIFSSRDYHAVVRPAGAPDWRGAFRGRMTR